MISSNGNQAFCWVENNEMNGHVRHVRIPSGEIIKEGLFQDNKLIYNDEDVPKEFVEYFE